MSDESETARAVRFEVVAISDAIDDGWLTRDDVCGDAFGFCLFRIQGDERRLIGMDGGPPEDQLLVRDWKWVAPALKAEYDAGRADERAVLARAVPPMTPDPHGYSTVFIGSTVGGSTGWARGELMALRAALTARDAEIATLREHHEARCAALGAPPYGPLGLPSPMAEAMRKLGEAERKRDAMRERAEKAEADLSREREAFAATIAQTIGPGNEWLAEQLRDPQVLASFVAESGTLRARALSHGMEQLRGALSREREAHARLVEAAEACAEHNEARRLSQGPWTCDECGGCDMHLHGCTVAAIRTALAALRGAP